MSSTGIFLCLNLQNKSKHIYLTKKTTLCGAFFTILALVQRAVAKGTGLPILREFIIQHFLKN